MKKIFILGFLMCSNSAISIAVNDSSNVSYSGGRISVYSTVSSDCKNQTSVRLGKPTVGKLIGDILKCERILGTNKWRRVAISSKVPPNMFYNVAGGKVWKGGILSSTINAAISQYDAKSKSCLYLGSASITYSAKLVGNSISTKVDMSIPLDIKTKIPPPLTAGLTDPKMVLSGKYGWVGRGRQRRYGALYVQTCPAKLTLYTYSSRTRSGRRWMTRTTTKCVKMPVLQAAGNFTSSWNSGYSNLTVGGISISAGNPRLKNVSYSNPGGLKLNCVPPNPYNLYPTVYKQVRSPSPSLPITYK